MRKIEMIGRKFERLLVINVAGKSGTKLLYTCECDCGAIVQVVGEQLRSGKTKSCGCYQREQTSKSNKTHGRVKTPEYNAWINMRRRCYDPTNDMFHVYGAIGITVCDRWNPKAGGSFENFLEDMGERPDGLSLERKDVNGNYCPENCIWAGIKQQAFNKRKRKNNSGRTGVRYVEKLGKWVSTISINKRLTHLGCFTSFEDAIRAREAAEVKYYGMIKPCETTQQTLLLNQVRKLRLAEDIDLERRQEEDE